MEDITRDYALIDREMRFYLFRMMLLTIGEVVGQWKSLNIYSR